MLFLFIRSAIELSLKLIFFVRTSFKLLRDIQNCNFSRIGEVNEATKESVFHLFSFVYTKTVQQFV